jgi:hypothetical protein
MDKADAGSSLAWSMQEQGRRKSGLIDNIIARLPGVILRVMDGE